VFLSNPNESIISALR